MNNVYLNTNILQIVTQYLSIREIYRLDSLLSDWNLSLPIYCKQVGCDSLSEQIKYLQKSVQNVQKINNTELYWACQQEYVELFNYFYINTYPINSFNKAKLKDEVLNSLLVCIAKNNNWKMFEYFQNNKLMKFHLKAFQTALMNNNHRMATLISYYP